jgi:hypothetical protein
MRWANLKIKGRVGVQYLSLDLTYDLKGVISKSFFMRMSL